ncbi:hypothetical protein B398_09330 [Xylella fastidiosa 32]|nr:hypothetical protein B398_09330 [Xylella fastidiosa 32]
MIGPFSRTRTIIHHDWHYRGGIIGNITAAPR